MKCPHCLDSFFEAETPFKFGSDADGEWQFIYCKCPNCKRYIMQTQRLYHVTVEGVKSGRYERHMVWPKGIARVPLSADVPKEFAGDYLEACRVLPDSPNASAALSRRCLQNLLRDKAKVKPSNLSDEIEEVMESLPAHLREAIDAVRNIGNFAAHPMKSTNTGGIIEVEPGEAEWLLDTLEGLFDFYFVQPATLKKKREALNKKLKEAGKPEMK